MLEQVEGDRVPAPEEPRRGVREDVHVGVAERGDDPLRLPLLGEGELGVDGHDRVVELPQDLVRVVEGAAVEDVALGPRQDRDRPFELLVERPDPGPVHPQGLGVEPLRDDERRGVVRDADVLVSPFNRRAHHCLQVVHAVRRVRVNVEVPADILELDEPRESAGPGGLDLPVLLPELGRDPREAEGRVDALLRVPRDLPLALEDPVLVEFPPAGDREAAEVDVVVLVPGEILEPGAPAPRLEDPDVRLDPRLHDHRRLRLARQDDLLHARHPGEGTDRSGRVGGRHEDIDVPRGLPHPPEAAGDGGLVDRGVVPEIRDDFLRDRERDGEQGPRLALLVELDRVEDLLLRLLPEALQPANLPALRRLLQVLHVRDPEGPPEHARPLRTEAPELHHLHEAARDLLREFIEGVHPPLAEVLVHLRRDRLPDPLDLAEAGDAALTPQLLDVLRHRLDLAGRAAIRHRSEPVPSLHLQEVRDVVQELGDLRVPHAARNTGGPYRFAAGGTDLPTAGPSLPCDVGRGSMLPRSVAGPLATAISERYRS